MPTSDSEAARLAAELAGKSAELAEVRREMQAQQRALATLLDASAALSATLDSRAALEQLARLVVPGLADWCAIDELAPDGQVRRLAVQHTDPQKVALAHEAVRRAPIDASDPAGIGHVLRTGQAEWAPHLPADYLDGLADPELRAIFAALGLRSYAVVPMIARGRVLGALSLVHAESGRGFTEVDLRLAQDLASRAALALDNARLYESAEASRVQLHDLFMHAPAAIGVSRGPEHIYELANEPYRRFVGRDELLGRRLREALPEPHGAGLLAIHDRVYASSEAFVSDDFAVADGRHFNVVYQPTRDAGGRVTGLATFGFEVSGHVRARRQLERSEARMRALVDATAAIVWTATPTGAVTEVSPSWLRFTGQTADEYLGADGFLAPMHPEDRASTIALWQAAVASQGAYAAEYRLRRHDGVYVAVLARGMPVRDAAGEVVEYIGCNVDISELREAEAAARGHAGALETINERLRLALEVTGLGTWDVDVRAGQFACDERCRALLGLPEQAVHRIGSGFAAVHADDRDELRAVLERAMDPTSNGRYDCEFRTRRTEDGAPLWVRGAGQVYFADGRAARLVGTMLDITGRKREEDDARRRGEFEQQLIGIVSHDLRNPISAMIMSAALLAQRLPADSPLASTAGRILSSGDRAVRLIRDLLDFTQARSASGIPIQRRAADVHAVCQQTVEEVMLGHPSRRVVHRPEGDGLGQWDPDRLAQVVSNLAVNAVTYSPVDTPVYIDSRGHGPVVVIEVHNQGPPIPGELLPTLFEPFKRRERRQDPDRSIGLGLFIVREIVEAHDGTVQARSSADGTVFRIELPRARDEPPAG